MAYDVDPITMELIKSQEGFSSKSYVDAQGRSIGYGHFIKKGEEHLVGAELTEEQAEDLLKEDIRKHQEPWAGLLNRKLNGAQMAALTSFAYNVGPGAVQKLIPMINEGKYEDAFAKMREYNKARIGPEAKLTVLDVLEKRRDFEVQLFERGLSDDADDASIVRTMLVKPFRSKIRAGKVWQEQKSYVQRIKEMFTGTQRTTRAFVDSGEVQGENELVLKGLMNLNTRLQAGSPFDIDEEAWASKVMQEGRGWAANS